MIIKRVNATGFVEIHHRRLFIERIKFDAVEMNIRRVPVIRVFDDIEFVIRFVRLNFKRAAGNDIFRRVPTPCRVFQ